MTIKVHNQTFQQWGLSHNPFYSTPPDEVAEVAAIFQGRTKELDRALPTLYEGRNVLIRGPWGIGKTAMIKTLLHHLQQEVVELQEEMLVLYLDGIPNVTIGNFYRAVLLAITKQMSEQSDKAKKVADSLTGMTIQSSKTKKEGSVNLGVFSIKLSDEPNASELRENDIYQQLLYWLKEAEEMYSKVVIAIDDLDKKETQIVQEIIENSLDLFRQGRSRAFILTGRGFTDMQEATLSALGIFSEKINLTPMSNADLRQIVINYLNTVRQSPIDSIDPFMPDVLDQIIEYAQGSPRQLNFICEQVLRQAAMQGHTSIDDIAWQIIWPEIQENLRQNLSPHIRRLLYIAYEQGGLNEDISQVALEKIGSLTFTAILPELKQLENMDLMMRIEDAKGFRFVPSKLYQPPASQSEDQKNT
jgi:Cdc6-like AAA superfamily ATPase